MRTVRRPCVAAVVAAAALTATACNNNPPSTFTPTIVAPPAKTETFTGTVAVGSSSSHAFTSSNYGQLDVTLTSAGPPATIVMGLGVGIPVSATDPTCQLSSTNAVSTAAGPTPQLSGNLQAGSYCVEIFDVGQQTDVVTYSVTVVHPQ